MARNTADARPGGRRARWPEVVIISALLIAVVVIAARPASAAAIPSHLRLTWQGNPSTTMTVTWDTDTGVDGYLPQVKYGSSPGSHPKTVTGLCHGYSGCSKTICDVELTGLSPKTAYYYVVGDASNGWSAEKSFRTAPAAGDNTPFKFLAYADSRNPVWLFENQDNAEFGIWGTSCNSMATENVLLGLFGGDCVYNASDESLWDEWNDKYSVLSGTVPSLIAHGNHEDYQQAFFDRFAFPGNEKWFSFDAGKVHFACLDTGLTDSGEQALIDQQKPWLESDLAAARAAGQTWLVLWFHRPPYATGSHGNQTDIIDGWIPIIDKYGVDLACCGHNHLYERTYPMRASAVTDSSSKTLYVKPTGTIYVTSGSCGAPLKDFGNAPWAAFQAKDYQYTVVDVSANRVMTVTTKHHDNPAAVMEQFQIVKTAAPAVTDISPTTVRTGETVTLKGSEFGSSRGTSWVTVGGVKAAQYVSWSDSSMEFKLPYCPGGAHDVTVTTPDGTSNAVSLNVIESTLGWYFAEGYTGTGFQEYLCIGNPNAQDTRATITYMYSNGGTKTQKVDIKANSRKTVDVNAGAGPDNEVSAAIASEIPLVVERPLYYNYSGKWPGGHDALGAKATSTKWYFAEGTTRQGFDEFITVLNPGASVAKITFRYMVEGKGEVVREATVQAHCRSTFSTYEQIGLDKDASLLLESDRGIVAERPIYFDYKGLAAHSWKDGHCVAGANALAKQWWFAEGTTRAGFEEWLCLQNPNASAIKVNARYYPGKGQGAPVDKVYSIGAKQRLTVSVNEELGPEKDVSVRLTSTADFMAERPIYFLYHDAWDGGHDVIGATAAGTEWYFAEGYTGAGFEEWLCLLNSNTAEAKVTVTYYPSSGGPIVKQHTVPASSRYTIPVNSDAGANLEISAKVASDKPIVAERPIYFDFHGWPGGHCVMGYRTQ